MQPIKKWNIYPGDRVQILVGKDAGQQGVVKQVIKQRNSITVQGLQLVKRHIRPTETRTGSISLQEGLIHVSNVNLVDPSTGKRTKIKVKKEEGVKVRYAVQTNTVIPIPEVKLRPAREMNPLTDTPASDVVKRTYVAPDYSKSGVGELFKLSQDEARKDERPPPYSQAISEYRHIVDFRVIK